MQKETSFVLKDMQCQLYIQRKQEEFALCPNCTIQPKATLTPWEDIQLGARIQTLAVIYFQRGLESEQCMS